MTSFDDADSSAARLAWVKRLAEIAPIDREVQRLYDYPQQFAPKTFTAASSTS
jgi:hypothetical protein